MNDKEQDLGDYSAIPEDGIDLSQATPEQIAQIYDGLDMTQVAAAVAQINAATRVNINARQRAEQITGIILALLTSTGRALRLLS